MRLKGRLVCCALFLALPVAISAAISAAFHFGSDWVGFLASVVLGAPWIVAATLIGRGEA